MLTLEKRKLYKRNYGHRILNEIFETEKEVAERYKISQRTLSELRKKGKLKVNVHYFYVVNQIRYNLTKLQDYFENDSQKRLEQAAC